MLSTDDDDENPKRKWDPKAPPISVKPDDEDDLAWLRLLPAPWRDNPRVVILMVPRDASFKVRKATDSQFKGTECAFVEFKRGDEDFVVPMQLIDRDYGNWVQQKKVVQTMAGQMHPVAFNGHLSDIPMRCMTSDGFMPIAVLFDEPHKEPLHILETFKNFTARSGLNG